MQSAPWTKLSSTSSGTARRMVRMSSSVFSRAGTALVVHGHLGRAVNFQTGVHLVDEPHGAEVLHDGGIDSAVDALAEMMQRLVQLGRLEKDVERQIDPSPVRVRQAARLLQVIQGQLRPLVPGIEPVHAEVDRIGAVAERGTNGVEAPGGSEEFRDGAGHDGKLTVGCGYARRQL